MLYGGEGGMGASRRRMWLRHCTARTGFGHHAEEAADDGHAHASGDYTTNDADHDVEESDGHQHDESEQHDE